jgi:hypothetical protein
MSEETFFCTGIDAVTGDYVLPPMSATALSRVILAQPREDEAIVRGLRSWFDYIRQGHLGLIDGLTPKELAQTGWGVIFAHDADPSVREALAPLLALRERQAGGAYPGGRYREFTGGAGHRPGESKNAFLARHNVGPGPVDPARGVPYYLLIVGSPDRIPYRFQYLLDVEHAVGRLYFDTSEEYALYARSVVEAETGGSDTSSLALPRRSVFFGVENEDDMATALTAHELVAPLAAWLRGSQADRGWHIDEINGADATRARFGEVLAGAAPPALLFTASHGVSFPRGHEQQRMHQGALLGSDWSAAERGQAVRRECYFSADDVADSHHVHGMIAFFFACYGGGTPRQDDFAHRLGMCPEEIAANDFVARLPQRLLAHPRGGALAVVGHVERAWTTSFLGRGGNRQLTVFEDFMRRLLDGHPVGSAMEPLGRRHAEMSTLLNDALEDIRFGQRPDDLAVASLWTAHHDARNYVVLGDPAVRLAVAGA